MRKFIKDVGSIILSICMLYLCYSVAVTFDLNIDSGVFIIQLSIVILFFFLIACWDKFISNYRRSNDEHNSC